MMSNGNGNGSLLEKIQKCLALAQGTPIQAESEQAMRMAQALMMKHNVTLAEVEGYEGGEDTREYVKEEIENLKYAPSLSRFIDPILKKFFFVRPVYYTGFEGYKTPKICIFGLRHNVEIALFVRGFLKKEYNRLWREHKKAMGYTHERSIRSFFEGLNSGFSEKLQEERDFQHQTLGARCTALVKVEKELSKKFAEAFPNLQKGRRSSYNHYSHDYNTGHQHGKNISLQKPVATGDQSSITERRAIR